LLLGVSLACVLAGGSTASGRAAPSTGGSSASARASAPAILSASCVPASACEPNPHRVKPGGRLLLTGPRLAPGQTVLFRATGPHPGSRAHATAHVRRNTEGLVLTVPHTAISGHIVVITGRRRSAPFGPIYIVHPRIRPGGSGLPTAPAGVSPFSAMGMWIWHLDKSDGGNLDALARRAHATGITTVFIKSSDGSTNFWPQFTPTIVASLKARGLKVCAWQYVYGTHPVGEAALGAQAVHDGADCLVIDAEAEYEGRYAAAQTYITRLRASIGHDYPVGLASFPYVDYHPALPFSVFLGPGAAQYNAPQMYWKAIGTSVDGVYAHTFTHNRIYGRPIFPLGQSYENPAPSQLDRFRALTGAYGLGGLSFWDWEETTGRGWRALGASLAPLTGFTPSDAWPMLTSGAKGDEVVWMQEHLAAVAPSTPTSGVFDSSTRRALVAFQTDHKLPVSGATDPATWQALLALAPVAVDYTGNSASASSARTGRPRRQGAPASARLRARRDEIPRVG